MSWGEEQDELMRFGVDPQVCARCHESVSGMCKFHRGLERTPLTGIEKKALRMTPSEFHEHGCKCPNCEPELYTPDPGDDPDPRDRRGEDGEW